MSHRRLRRRLPAAALVLGALTASSAVAAASSSPPAPARPTGGWVHVQLADLATPEQVDALALAGLREMQYVPHNAYVAYGAADAARRARAVAGVAGVRPIAPADKLDRQALAGEVSRVSVLGAGGASGDLAAVLREVAVRDGGRHVLGASGIEVHDVTLRRADIRRVAQRPDVLLVSSISGHPEVEDEATAQVLAGRTVGYSPKPGYRRFLGAAGVDGTGVVVTVIDDGLDPAHPELFSRIRARHQPTPEPPQGHGTHVAGIIGGKGALLPVLGRAKDADGLEYGLGIAPGVSFVDLSAVTVGASNLAFPPAGGFGVFTKQALAAGSSLWNASWTTGEGTGAGYVESAAAFDVLARDADDATDGAQPFTFVFSAGNSGSAEGTVTAPKEAKNMITVASTIAPRGAFPSGSSPDDEKISTFSSRGPARDGRLIPTVSAPGQNVVSARATTGALCGTSPPLDGYALYSLCSGTSMASPQVTGAVALLTQWWRTRHAGATPSPAMAKAMLVNSAVDIGDPDVPNVAEGWGRVHTGHLLDPRAHRVTVDQRVVLTRRGASYDVRVVPVDPSRPMKVTLTWTDPPGIPQEPREDRDIEAWSPPALVNDLDLVVEDSRGRLLGNVFAAGWSTRKGKPDRLNNVENVFVERPAGGYRVTVRAHNLPGDAIPGNARRVEQDFALVISNARVVG